MIKQTKKILDDINYLNNIFTDLLEILPSFKITDKKVLPYGLKPHTRSVSWLVEQVITQQLKYNRNKLKIDKVFFDLSDTCLHDCEIRSKNETYFVNIKVHNMAKKENKNDIAAVEKLYMQYSSNSNYNLISVCFGIHFENIIVKFDTAYLVLFSPQFMPIYINPRNDKIQAFYHHESKYRTRQEFLDLLKNSSKSIIL